MRITRLHLLCGTAGAGKSTLAAALGCHTATRPHGHPRKPSTMTLAPAIAAFWAEFVQASEVDPTPRFYEAFFFDDNEASANALAELVLQGTKRATAASLWAFEAQAQTLPKPGHLCVVTRFDGEPVCVIETEKVTTMPFSAVDANFAAIEGEGDGSLGYWRQAHTAYFGRECARLGAVFSDSMPVVCEVFKVVYRAKRGRAP